MNSIVINSSRKFLFVKKDRDYMIVNYDHKMRQIKGYCPNSYCNQHEKCPKQYMTRICQKKTQSSIFIKFAEKKFIILYFI